jgi:hypothetical protein
MQKGDHIKTTFIHLAEKKNATLDYAKTNNLHVM